MPRQQFCIISPKIILLKLLPHLPGSNELKTPTEKKLIARFMGPTWGPSGTDMLAPWTLLSGNVNMPLFYASILKAIRSSAKALTTQIHACTYWWIQSTYNFCVNICGDSSYTGETNSCDYHWRVTYISSSHYEYLGREAIMSYEYLRQNKHRFITGLMVYVIKTYFSTTKSLSKPIYNPGVDEIFER